MGLSGCSAVYSAAVNSALSSDAMSEPEKQPAPTPATVLARLREHYGTPEPRRSDGPLAELVQTILSQNTSDVNTERAFASLWAHFGSWDAIRTAPVSEIA